ncbi:hypothetical protein BH11PSE10_BH11PSE10_18860 [soil metagenome]
MRNVRRAGAFFSGVILYSGAVVLSSFLASLRWPSSVYHTIGARSSLPVVIGEASLIALLLFVISLIWCSATIRPGGPLRRGHRPTTAWCLGGLGLAWLGWTIYGAVYFSLHPRSYSQPLTNLLLSSLTPPLWGVLNTVGVVGGGLLAGVLARRARQAARGDARPGSRYTRPGPDAPPLAKMISV